MPALYAWMFVSGGTHVVAVIKTSFTCVSVNRAGRNEHMKQMHSANLTKALLLLVRMPAIACRRRSFAAGPGCREGHCCGGGHRYVLWLELRQWMPWARMRLQNRCTGCQARWVDGSEGRVDQAKSIEDGCARPCSNPVCAVYS